jgi:hypothetical protein
VVLVVGLDEGGVEEVVGGGEVVAAAGAGSGSGNVLPGPLDVLALAAEVVEVVGEAEEEVDPVPPRLGDDEVQPLHTKPAIQLVILHSS